MAEKWTIAFGRYLRILRERRGLALDDVTTMSRLFADPVDKSYLSRCENGVFGLAASKMIPLCRIYEVPPQVLFERLELDMELDKIGSPDTEGLDYEQLSIRGRDAAQRGTFWESYAYFRDSTRVARSSKLMGRLRDETEQYLCSFINLSTGAANLGRPRLALHELEYVRSTSGLSARIHPILLERLATVYLVLEELAAARGLADQAIEEGEKLGLDEFLGYFYSSRAKVAEHERDWAGMIALYQKAHEKCREAGQHQESCRTLFNLAAGYQSAGRIRSARRVLASSERQARALGMDRLRALIRLAMGEIEDAGGAPDRARACWEEAAQIARRLNERTVTFRAEFRLYQMAIRLGREATARTIERRLSRLSAWLGGSLEEVADFKKSLDTRRQNRRRSVSRPQSSS